MKITTIKVVCFDADDTLWHNENYFRETEDRFAKLLSEYGDKAYIDKELFDIEMANMTLYGYGIKAFVLSMIETALKVSNRQIAPPIIAEIVMLGKAMLEKPVELMPDVEKVLQLLQPNYRLIVATKGDLLDQERKVKRSGLEHFFHHIEVMSDKTEGEYHKLIGHLDIQPSEFLMVGNSLKSDILPVLSIGGYAMHVPYHTTWLHEQIDKPIASDRFFEAQSLIALKRLLL